VTGYHAIHVDVRFDHAGAAALAASFRGAAATVDRQVDARASQADAARPGWEVATRTDFDRNHAIAVADGDAVAQALREVAALLDQASADAHAEQARRDAARAERQAHEDRNWLEKGRDWLLGR
jgi:uncharacterized protein YukE